VNVAKLLTKLEKQDLRILMAVEIGMKRSEYVTVSNIKFYSRYKMEETLFRLKKVHKQDLIIRDASKHEIAYTLNSKAYDLLALHTLVEKNIISQLGPLIGKGKESDVYGCMNDAGDIYAAKIYRIGRTSFKNIKQLRDLIGDRGHLSWLYINRLAAKNPMKIFNKIIKQLRIIYKKGKMIHGDLGEFNIVLDNKGNILIIDWLQWVPIDHPNANSLLERDIGNICSYFTKKFKIESNVDEILNSFYKK